MHRDDLDIDGSEGACSLGTEHIRVDTISKVEGHGKLDVKVKGGKVEYVKLKITESKRFYTQAIRGKPAISLPLSTSRICGTCSIAHLTCCAEAVEKAIGYEPSEQTLLLRKLSLYGMMIRDHALHLYLFELPDLMGKDSILDFDESKDEMIKHAFAVKSSGNNLSKAVAGRAVHATYAEVGRFSHIPDREAVKKVIAELKSVRQYAIDFIDLFYKCNFSLERDTDFVSLVTKDYSFLEGSVCDSNNRCIEENNYMDYLKKVVKPYSTAVSYRFDGRDYIVGALARMNLNKQSLHRDTRADTGKYSAVFPSKNIFHNNLAQAIEILHCIDHSVELLESSEFKQENEPPVKIKEGSGVGLIEAPRGTLYYALSIGKDGKCIRGDIIVPTQQNQIAMEKSVAKLVEDNMGMGKKKLEYEIEKLIRAYDPCMSCASHFLKINWK